MTTSANLAIPYLAPAQAQKHVTVNEALRKLDAIVQLGVASATTTAQPASPSDGAVYILPAGKTGAAWGAMGNGALAYYRDGAWEQITPKEGWLAFVRDTDQLLVYSGTAWANLPALAIGSQGATRGLITIAGPANSTGGAFGGVLRLANTSLATGQLDLLVGAWGPGAGCQVGVFRSAVTNQQTALDLCPNGVAGDVWMDLCSTDVVADITNWEALEVRKFKPSGSDLPGFGSISTKRAGTGTLRGLVLQRYGGGCVVVDGVVTPNPALNTFGVQTSAAVGGITIHGTTHPALTFTNGTLTSYIGFPTLTGDYFAADAVAGDLIVRGTGFRVAAAAGGVAHFATTSTDTRFGSLPRPVTDNTLSLGASGARWSQVYAATGTINTSDAAEKTALAPISDALRRAAARIRAGIGVFQWLDAVTDKGADGARLHIGVTAQAVRDAFLAEGLDPWRFGLFCADPLIERVEVEVARPGVDLITGEATMLPPRFEERPTLGPDGAPRLRLGVRSDQLALLLAAA